ncbi:MAG: alanine:cation symporter family protein [Gemmatimonadota bacterium]
MSVDPRSATATAQDGSTYSSLYGPAVESAAPLTQLGFERGLPGSWGGLIVLVSVLLFAISTAISWSYYGDRCAFYLFGSKAVLPYKMAFVTMHFVGAVAPLAAIWAMGDVFLGIVILPNLLGIFLLSPRVREATRSYFKREPWRENYEVHKRLREEKKAKR